MSERDDLKPDGSVWTIGMLGKAVILELCHVDGGKATSHITPEQARLMGEQLIRYADEIDPPDEDEDEDEDVGLLVEDMANLLAMEARLKDLLARMSGDGVSPGADEKLQRGVARFLDHTRQWLSQAISDAAERDEP